MEDGTATFDQFSFHAFYLALLVRPRNLANHSFALYLCKEMNALYL